jgi:hypothetical protein
MAVNRRHLLLGLFASVTTTSGAHAANLSALIDPFEHGLEARRFPRAKPFVAVYGQDGKKLGFVAAVHSVDPASPTFGMVQAAFAHLSPKLVIIEGFPTAFGLNPDRIMQMVLKADAKGADTWARGEGGFAAASALRASVPFEGGDPTDKELLADLMARGFPARDVMFTEMLKVLAEEARAKLFPAPHGKAFESAFVDWAKSLSHSFGQPQPSTDDFRTWYLQTFGLSLHFDEQWTEQADPVGTGLSARIAREQSLLRDNHLYQLMIRRLDTESSVVVVFGASHLASLWRALEASLGMPKLLS